MNRSLTSQPQRNRRSLVLAAVVGLFLPAVARPAARFPITLVDVAAALAAQQPALAASALDIPTMTAGTPNPSLVVEALHATGPHTAQARVACRDTAACLPFYVQIHSTGTTPVPFAAPLPAPPLAPRRALSQPPAIRSGEHAELHIDSGGLHISLPVICLASGQLGGEIRVTGLDHRMIYTARIVSPSLLQGSL
jgi:hypothetical protein